MQSIRPWRPCRLVAVLRMPSSELLWSICKTFLHITEAGNTFNISDVAL